MLGGEEQYVFGLVDHDGVAGWKYEESKQIAKEFKLLQEHGLPRRTEPEITIAYLFESLKVMALRLRKGRKSRQTRKL